MNIEAVAEANGDGVDFVNIERDDLVETLGNSDRCCFVYVVPIFDGKLYIGTAPTQAALSELLNKDTVGDESYVIDKDIAPIVLSNKSKWDLAKYTCLLVEKYGWSNIVFSEAQFE